MLVPHVIYDTDRSDAVPTAGACCGEQVQRRGVLPNASQPAQAGESAHAQEPAGPQTKFHVHDPAALFLRILHAFDVDYHRRHQQLAATWFHEHAVYATP